MVDQPNNQPAGYIGMRASTTISMSQVALHCTLAPAFFPIDMSDSSPYEKTGGELNLLYDRTRRKCAAAVLSDER